MKEFIEKLIGRLEERIFSAELYNDEFEGKTIDNLICLGDVTEIVNQLAEEYNNDFCEWQEKTAGGIKLVKEPHKQRLFHIQEERQYCPYCEKKIKVVE